MINWQEVLKYITEHALVIGIAGTFGLIGTTVGSITAHHIRKLRRKTAPKVYLTKIDKLEAKAERLRQKKVAKTIGKFDARTEAIFYSKAFDKAIANGYVIQDSEKNVVTNTATAGLSLTGNKTTVLKLG